MGVRVDRHRAGLARSVARHDNPLMGALVADKIAVFLPHLICVSLQWMLFPSLALV